MSDSLIFSKPAKVLVVCMGNICRSPTMEAVLAQTAAQRGLSLEVDSAGTIAYHQGNPPDKRSAAAARKRGYDLSSVKARQVQSQDFEHFDLILCADEQNLADLQSRCPEQYQHKLALFLRFGEQQQDEVPDPYYGGTDGFELVLDLVEHASDIIIAKLSKQN
ncbi:MULTISPECIES: low molecular weight protein-tyrosine-phosphatase [unclassified Pseudoalteromonas]|uniref:low molecular weight protein-tyrosine-phosphatase n=1 Tax=unclassified Pseudoalteromonas TaxID=194690 RepID=UPI002097FA53|nr:low molecular weight protein-tyrosine-phosphatase [Pseudoalteromonas sp. XMcav2-N]MCO7189055.1 low molecular weight phosphotyrosine protein phosphatase [Pseudoalteromonas sp. XMcav2-N]